MTDPAEAARRFVDGVRARHAACSVREALAAIRPLRALVVGEAIVDEYSYCTPVGKAPKDPMISARHVRLERHAGGALACANHLAGVCDAVDLLSCLGADDTQETFIRERLRPNVAPRFFVRAGAPTITKRRYVAEGVPVKLFEIVAMDDTPLPSDLEDRMLAHLDRTLPAYDVVIVADYGHGLLGPRSIGLLAARARFLAVNCQANPSSLGFHVVTRYPRADYVCLDENEIRLALRDRWGPVPALIETLRGLLKPAAIAVTRGHQGVVATGADAVHWEIPALSHEVVDRMGAGDAYLAVTAPCVAAGLPTDLVGLLGSAAAGLAVRTVGNRDFAERAAVEHFVDALLA
jgi:bifunctional ADP-heptose synthase (sugar kinase/adenylyltransferase)